MSSQRRPLKWAKVFVRKRLSGKCFWSPSIFMSNRHRPIFPRVFMMVTDNYLNQNIFFCHISSLLSLLASERFQMSLSKSLQAKNIQMKNTEEEILRMPYSLSEKSQLFLAQICRNIPLEKISATWKGVAIWVVVDSKPVSGFDANSALYKICTEKYHFFEGSYLLKQALIFWKEVVVSK